MQGWRVKTSHWMGMLVFRRGPFTGRCTMSRILPNKKISVHGTAGVWGGGAPFCIGCPWQGVEAMYRELIHIPYLLRRLRRSRVYGGFVFCFGFCAQWFRVISLVSAPALGLLCGGFVFAKLTIIL